MFESVPVAPADPILGVTEAWRQDPNPRKVNLGVGVYMDDEGHTPVLQAVKAAEAALLGAEKTKSYLPIAGEPEYGRRVQELIFAAAAPALAERAFTAYAPGGTGALRVAAEFLREYRKGAAVWVSAPTWANHKGIFKAAGFSLKEYPYYRPETHAADATAMLGALDQAAPGDIVLLHVCCHNPSGADLTPPQWKMVAEKAVARGLLPLLDFAYLGFGESVEADRLPLDAFAATGAEFMVATSFSKNMGLYRERVGALTLVAGTPAVAGACASQLRCVIRVIYSNPAAHGQQVALRLMSDAVLRATWMEELTAMRARIARMRIGLVEALRVRGAPRDFSFVTSQRGMFSFSGLSDRQSDWLRRERAIYLVGGGRINVAGLTTRNLDYVADAIVEALKVEPS